MNLLVDAIVLASIWREGVDFALLDECGVWSDPWVDGVEILECILLLVLPLRLIKNEPRLNPLQSCGTIM